MTTFVSIGNGVQPFTRLLEEVKRIAPQLPQPVIVQHGRTPFDCGTVQKFAFVDSDEFQRILASCSVFITHGGSGSVFSALKLGKKAIVVPRRARDGEIIDDHQLNFVRELSSLGMIIEIDDVRRLLEGVSRLMDDPVLPTSLKSDKNPEAEIGKALGKYAPLPQDKIALVTPPGGHLNEIEFLRGLYQDHPHFYVTNSKIVEPPHMKDLVHVITFSHRDWRFFLNIKEAYDLLRRERPKVILTTGGGFSVAFALAGKLMGIPTVYIETAAKVGTPTETGKVMYWLTRDFFYQWPQVGKHFPGARCIGLLL